MSFLKHLWKRGNFSIYIVSKPDFCKSGIGNLLRMAYRVLSENPGASVLLCFRSYRVLDDSTRLRWNLNDFYLSAHEWFKNMCQNV